MCLAIAFGFYAGQYLAVVGLLPTMLVGAGLTLAAAGLLTSVVSLANVPGNLLGAFLQHRGVPRWVLIGGGSVWLALTVWGVLDPGLPVPGRVACALAFALVVGVVPSAAFSGVVAMSAGTASAGAAVGLLVQGSSVGQLLGPPLVVGVGSAVGSWVGSAATITCLAAVLLVGGLLYRRLEKPLAPERSTVDRIVDNPDAGSIVSGEVLQGE
jgi:cyanate permease